MEKTCCGFGHRIVIWNVEYALRIALCDVIENWGITRFLTGGMGEFDELFAKNVRSLREKYPQIRLCLVCPYLTKKLNEGKGLLSLLYDAIIIPAELDGTYKKATIPLRNRWMVEQSDVVISAVYRDFGGAYEAVAYAAKHGVPIVQTRDIFS